MNLLAIDTTAHSGGIALACDGEILEAVSIEAPDGFGEVIYPEIEALLSRAGLALHDIDGYAAAAGPGSFTGIRVGLSVVKSLAEVHGKKVAPVSNLRALAYAGTGKYRAPVMDARRGEVYAAVYGADLRPLVDEVMTEWKNFRSMVGDRPVTFVSLDSGLFNEAGAAPLGTNGHGTQARAVVAEPPLAAAVAGVAQAVFVKGEALVPEAVDANYIRRPDAELKWKDPD